jgi:hypothetical protein
MLPQEVFLSHSDRDRPFVTELADMMRHHGIPVWYSRTNILGAQQWHDEIGAALRRCEKPEPPRARYHTPIALSAFELCAKIRRQTVYDPSHLLLITIVKG